MNLRSLASIAGLLMLVFPAAAQDAPAPGAARFVDKGEYVIDSQTGLWWQKDGQASGKKNFYDAAKYAASLKLAGRTGWRVPTAKELANIFPADQAPFTNSAYNKDMCCGGPNEFRSYWTSELDPRVEDYAYVYQWYAKGGANNCFASKNFVYVRCVFDPKGGGAAAAASAAEDKPLTDAEATKALELIQQLGDENFVKREAAAAGLKALGPRILPLVTIALGKSKDPEVRARLKKLVDQFGE